MTNKIRMGMVGGGHGAFIGAIHRLAAEMTGTIDLLAGAFSSDADASRSFGLELGLTDQRAYRTYEQMLDTESTFPEDERIQCVSIVTPNSSHADISCKALACGMHVICDKPLAGTLEDAKRIEKAVHDSGRLFGLTHTYTGYPMVIEARARVANGAIGNVRRVAVHYLQDWLSRAEDTDANKQSQWRSDPAIGGESGAFADIGTHAFNLVEYITGSSISEIAAELRTVIPERLIDDDGAALFRMSNGASGTLTASQVCSGAVNSLRVEIYGDKGSLHWAQEEPNTLIVKMRGEPDQVLRPGTNVTYLSDEARARCRTPGGHPEGYIEAFSNLYADFAAAVAAFPDQRATGCASVVDGVRGMRFIRAAITSSQHSSQWTAV